MNFIGSYICEHKEHGRNREKKQIGCSMYPLRHHEYRGKKVQNLKPARDLLCYLCEFDQLPTH